MPQTPPSPTAAGEARYSASIASGASEYVTEPVEIPQLTGLLRSWLERRPRPDGRSQRHHSQADGRS